MPAHPHFPLQTRPLVSPSGWRAIGPIRLQGDAIVYTLATHAAGRIVWATESKSRVDFEQMLDRTWIINDTQR